MGFFDKLKSKNSEGKKEAPAAKPAAAPAKPAAAAAAAPKAESKTESKPVEKKDPSAAFIEEIATRRTVYALNKELPISEEKITKIVKDVVYNTPSSFNSQPVRAVIVYGDNHTKLWDEIAVDALKKVVREEAWESTGTKLKGFAGAAGTVLFFEETSAITKMQEQFPSYAANFPIWAGHTSGATQINTWNALALEKVGANLQHYSPLIDEGVAKAFDVPEGWVLTAQLVFGGIAAPAQAPEKSTDTVKVAA